MWKSRLIFRCADRYDSALVYVIKHNENSLNISQECPQIKCITGQSYYVLAAQRRTVNKNRQNMTKIGKSRLLLYMQN